MPIIAAISILILKPKRVMTIVFLKGQVTFTVLMVVMVMGWRVSHCRIDKENPL